MYPLAGDADAVRLVEGLNREETCVRYQEKITLIARRLASRVPGGVGLACEDLAAHGAIGLLQAFDHFDPSWEVKFRTYASYRIRGAMLDALREHDPLGRRGRMLARRINQTEHRLLHRFGQPAEPGVLAGELDMDMDTYWKAVQRTAPVCMVSVEPDGTLESEGPGGPGRILASPQEDVLQALVCKDVRDALRQATAQLPERTRQCLVLYYGRNLTMSEIAKVFDLSPPRISQILKEARERLRRMLGAVGIRAA